MTDTIEVGTMLIADGTETPESVVIATSPYLPGWSFLSNARSAEFGRKLETAGWTFFYMADEITTKGLGQSVEFRIRKAMARLVASVERQNCNCLEITQVRKRSFFGVPSISIGAHARHIQKSRFFHELPPDFRPTPRASPPVRSRHAAAADRVVQRWENEGGSLA